VNFIVDGIWLIVDGRAGEFYSLPYGNRGSLYESSENIGKGNRGYK
jgi:hypothetical protein